MGISTDITERKRAEEEVCRLNAELEQRVRELEVSTKELDTFAYSVSHDLRAPLGSVAGLAEIMLEDHADRLDEEAQQYLRRIHDKAARSSQLIDDLLRLSRVTRAELRRERVDLSRLARAALADLRDADPRREVNATIDDGLVRTGDTHLVQLALNNLIANAWNSPVGVRTPGSRSGRIGVIGFRSVGSCWRMISRTASSRGCGLRRPAHEPGRVAVERYSQRPSPASRAARLRSRCSRV
ncbi:histidine kinase dimerization/phospho-acceptor domain-containing protein [Actinoplanes sp. NPDC049118]|uniref:sensor histidine kinase n=1 Tax=Actinoplanes sp. NPDC049118 TaxID=3155769 RepID=UPI0033CE6560